MDQILEEGPPSHNNPSRKNSKPANVTAPSTIVRIEEIPRVSRHTQTMAPTTPFSEQPDRVASFVQVPLSHPSEKARAPPRIQSRNPAIHKGLRLLSLVPGLVGIGLIGGLLNNLPKEYKRTWRFSRADTAEKVDRITNSILYCVLTWLLSLFVLSLCWNLIENISRPTRRVRRGLHPGAHIAIDLIFTFLTSLTALVCLFTAKLDMDPNFSSARFWLSNTRIVNDASPRNSPLPHRRNTDLNYRGNPDPASKRSRLMLAYAGSGLASALSFLHFLMFLAACRDLNLRRKQQRQELKDRVAERRDAEQVTQPSAHAAPRTREGHRESGTS